MKLSALSHYARRKYQINELHKWEAFPGFSVLCHPDTGKWIALLMKQKDPKTGEEIERCDIKCGPLQCEPGLHDWLHEPFRMRGENWIGVEMDHRTDPMSVYSMLDYAIAQGRPKDTIVLFDPDVPDEEAFGETKLDFGHSAPIPKKEKKPEKREIPLPANTMKGIPERIEQMRRLYDFTDRKPGAQLRNFLKQAKFMEDYEDDQPWNGPLHLFYPSYHSLNLVQLRGYFTWRTRMRKGEFVIGSNTYLYLYIYELLNGIGVSSPQEILNKLEELLDHHEDLFNLDVRLLSSLRRWHDDFIVMHNLPAEKMVWTEYRGSEYKVAMLERLYQPEEHSDQEIMEALRAIRSKTSFQTLEKKDTSGRAAHMVAAVWKELMLQSKEENGFALFQECFGEMQTSRWYPYSNALCPIVPDSTPYSFQHGPFCKYDWNGKYWMVRKFESIGSGTSFFTILIRTMDRVLRRYLKTGTYLSAKAQEAQAQSLVEQAIHRVEVREAIENRPKVEIDFSSLEKIRSDAEKTRDSLLTEEELGHAQQEPNDHNVLNEAKIPNEPNEQNELNLDSAYSGLLQNSVRQESLQDRSNQLSNRLESQSPAADDHQNSLEQSGAAGKLETDQSTKQTGSTGQNEQPEQAESAEKVKQAEQVKHVEQTEPAKQTKANEQYDQTEKTRNTEQSGFIQNTESGQISQADRPHHLEKTLMEGRESNTPSVDSSHMTAASAEPSSMTSSIHLDADHLELMNRLLDHANVQDLITAHHWLLSVVADTINEAFFDEIGDSVVEYDGSSLHLVEDYEEDVRELMGGDA